MDAQPPASSLAASIGLIGHDPQCALLAHRLAHAGRRVLHYMGPGTAHPLHGPNIESAATPTDIAFACEIVLLAIDETAAVRQLLMGGPDRAGLASELASGSVVIDLGVRPPRETQGLIGILGTRGIGLVDAALIGAHEAIASGTLTVLAGGFPDALDKAEPVLAEFGRVQRTGTLGSAQTAAALMGYVEAAHVAARSQALAMGSALGLAPDTLASVFQDSHDTANIVRLNRRADLVRVLAEERGLGGDVIDFMEHKRHLSSTESR